MHAEIHALCTVYNIGEIIPLLLVDLINCMLHHMGGVKLLPRINGSLNPITKFNQWVDIQYSWLPKFSVFLSQVKMKYHNET